jgi:hypothetical protein
MPFRALAHIIREEGQPSLQDTAHVGVPLLLRATQPAGIR